MLSLNKTIFYLLIITIVGAVLTLKIVATAYSGVYDGSAYEAQIVSSK
jgi:hypothetical protein